MFKLKRGEMTPEDMSMLDSEAPIEFYKTATASMNVATIMITLNAFADGEIICRKVDNSTYETYPQTDAVFPLGFDYLPLKIAEDKGYKILRYDNVGNCK